MATAMSQSLDDDDDDDEIILIDQSIDREVPFYQQQHSVDSNDSTIHSTEVCDVLAMHYHKVTRQQRNAAIAAASSHGTQ